MSMRVLITAGAGGGGITTSLIVLVEGLITRGHKVFCALWVDDAGQDDYMVLRLEQAGAVLRVETLSGIPFAQRFWRRVSAVQKMVCKWEIDVVNPHYGGDVVAGPIVLGAMLAKTPSVASFHGGESVQKFSLAWLKDRCFGRLASFTTVINGDMLQEVENRLPRRDNVVIVYSPGLPMTAVIDREGARARHGIRADDLVIGTVSRLDENKRVGKAIEAFHQSSAFTNGAKYVLCGYGPLEKETVQLGRDLLGDSFIFLGTLEDPGEAYSLIDIFILLSASEGLGNCFVEASRMGLPSIGTQVGGVPEIVLHGKTGYTVNRDELGEAVSAIDSLAENSETRIQFGRAALAHSEHFNPKIYLDKFEDIFSQACQFAARA